MQKSALICEWFRSYRTWVAGWNSLPGPALAQLAPAQAITLWAINPHGNESINSGSAMADSVTGCDSFWREDSVAAYCDTPAEIILSPMSLPFSSSMARDGLGSRVSGAFQGSFAVNEI